MRWHQLRHIVVISCRKLKKKTGRWSDLRCRNVHAKFLENRYVSSRVDKEEKHRQHGDHTDLLSIFQKGKWPKISIQLKTVDKVQKPNNSEYYTPSSESTTF
jgi:hypothetical protein